MQKYIFVCMIGVVIECFEQNSQSRIDKRIVFSIKTVAYLKVIF